MKDMLKTIVFIVLAVIICNAIFPDLGIINSDGLLGGLFSSEDTAEVPEADPDKMLSPVNAIIEACIKGDTSIDINELQEWSTSNAEEVQKKIGYTNDELRESFGNNISYTTKIEDCYLLDKVYYKMIQKEDALAAKYYKHYVNKLYFTSISVTITGDKGSQTLNLKDINLYNDSGKYVFWLSTAEDFLSTLRYHDNVSSQ